MFPSGNPKFYLCAKPPLEEKARKDSFNTRYLICKLYLNHKQKGDTFGTGPPELPLSTPSWKEEGERGAGLIPNPVTNL